MISELNLPFSTVKDANITSEELIEILNSQKENNLQINNIKNK